MFFYTFIMEYEGGTYISQVHAKSVEAACFEWAKTLKISEINDLEEMDIANFIEELDNEDPTEIEGIKNVWFLSLLTRNDKFALINIVQTDDNTDNQQLTTNN